MKESKIVHVPDLNILEKDKDGNNLPSPTNMEMLEIALRSILHDVAKVNSKNYLASTRFRVNSVELEKVFKCIREYSPVRKRNKK
jgi:hypothetical protein